MDELMRRGINTWFALLLVVTGLTLAGCVRGNPYQREILAKPCMQQDRVPLQQKLEAHVEEYREGSIGGTGVGVGGCGCN